VVKQIKVIDFGRLEEAALRQAERRFISTNLLYIRAALEHAVMNTCVTVMNVLSQCHKRIDHLCGLVIRVAGC
jgi:hypothetical protein